MIQTKLFLDLYLKAKFLDISIRYLDIFRYFSKTVLFVHRF